MVNNDVHASHHESETTSCMYHTTQHHADPGWGDFALRYTCVLLCHLADETNGGR